MGFSLWGDKCEVPVVVPHIFSLVEAHEVSDPVGAEGPYSRKWEVEV